MNSATTICSGSSTSLSLSIAPYECSGGSYTINSYQWQSSSDNVTFSNIAGATTSTYTASPVSNTYYRCIITLSGGSSTCNGASSPYNTASVLVTVNTASTAPTGASVDVNNFCSGTSGNISLTAAGGAIGSGALVKWYTGSCGGTSVGTGSPLSVAKPTTTTTYYVRYENVCNNTTCAQVTVNVNPLPAAPAGTGAARCGTGTVTISATPGAGETIDWYAASSGGASLLSGNTSYTTPSISSTATYYAQARNTTTGCISATRTGVTATVNTVPAAPTAGNAARCGTGTVTITASSAGNTIDWYDAASGGTLLLSGNTSYTTPSISGTMIYYAETRTVASGCTSTSRTAVTATVNTVPAAPAAGDNARCGTGTVGITATPGAGETIDWYAAASGGSALLSGNTNYTTPSIATTTTYYAEARNTTTGCASSSRTAVAATVNPIPVMTSASTASICSGDMVNIPLTSTVASDYTWIAADNANTTGESTSLQGISTINDVITNNTTSSKNVIYTVTPTSTPEGCTGPDQTVTVTVYAPPVITSEPDPSQTVCNTYPVTFGVTATGDGLTYQWYKGATALTDNASITGSNTNQLTIDPTAASDAGTYHVVVSGSAPCADATSANAVLNIDQIISITTQPVATQTFCEGQTATFSVASTGSNLSYQWRRGATTNLVDGGNISGATGPTLTVSNLTTADGTSAATRYNVVIIDAAVDPGDCNTAFSNNASLVVNKKSLDPTSATASVTTICNGASTTLTLNGGGGGTGEAIKWYTASCGGTLAGTGNNLIVSPTTTTTYYGRYEDPAPCNYNSNCASVTITVNQKSADPTSATATPALICSGQSTTLTLNGGGGGDAETIKWYTASCGGTLVGSGDGLVVSPATTITYYGRYEDAAPCSYNSACVSVTVTVNQKSANPTSATASLTTICIGGSTTLTLNGGGGGTGEVITWYSGSCGGTLVGTGNGLSVSPAATTTYYGRYEDPAPCAYNSTCASITINVSQLVTTSNAGPDQTICGTSTALAANNPATGTGSWSIASSSGGNGASFGGGGSDPTATFSIATFSAGSGQAIYTLVWTIANSPCTSSTDTVIVTFKKSPAANAGTDKTPACGTTTTTLGATAALSGQTGTWTIISGTGGTVTNPNSATSTFTSTAVDMTTYTLVWTVTNPPCTVATDTMTVTVVPPITGNNLQFIAMCRDATTGAPLPIIGQKPGVTLQGGTGTYIYSWERSCNGNSSWGPLTGETGPTVIVPQNSVNCFYRRTVTSGGCSNTSPGNGGDGHINVNNLPSKFDSITPTPTAAYCNGGTGIQVGVTNTIQGNGTDYTTSYELYRDGISTGLVVAGNNGTAYFSPNQTIAGTYTVRETIALTSGNSNSCGSTFTKNSLVLSIDANVTPAVAGSPQTVCAFTTMTGNTPVVGTGMWTLVSGSGTITTPADPATTVTALGTGANTFKWKITNGTCADSSNVTITAYQPNVAGTPAANPATICNGVSSALSQTGGVLGTGASWQWYTDASYNAASKVGGLLTGAASLTVSPSTTTTYYLRAEGATAPCQVNTPSGSVTVNVNPRPTSVISGTTPICFGGSTPITIDLTGTQPWSLTYLSSSTGTSTVVNGITTSPYTFSASPAGTTTYTVTALSDVNCTSLAGDRTGSATVTVNPLPTATIAGTITVCQDDASPGVTFTGANGTAPYTFTYTDYLGNTQTASGSPSVTVAGPPTSAAGSFTYTLASVQDNSSTTCSQIISGQAATITVNPKPVIDDPQASINTCAGSVSQSPTITGTVIPAGTTYTWGAPAMTGGMTGGSTGTNQAFTTGTFTNTTTSVQTATYTITPQSGAGCTGAPFTLVVNVSPSIAGTAVWLGTTSTDWCTASNWSCGLVPSSSVNAIIPAGPTNMPVIDGSCAAFVKDLDVQAGATLDLTSGNSLSIFGEFINQDESVFNLDGTVNFAGTNQNIPAFTYYGLQVTGGGNKTLLGDVIINGPLILTNGVIVSSPTNMLTISTTGSVTAGSDQSYINGPLTRETDQAVTYFFPVGGGGVIRVASVTPSDNTPSSYTVYYQTPTPAGPMGGADLFGTQTGEYWDVTKNFGIDAIPGFYYKNPNGLPAGAPTTDWTTGYNPCWFCNVAVVEQDIMGNWYYTGGINYAGGFAPTESTYWQSNGYVDARVPITDNNTPHQYSFGYGYAIVLPVTLLDFTGVLQGNNALLTWSFAAGSDVASTELQHSTDGRHFSKLTVKTAGSFNTYDYMHFNLQPGAHYYRLLIKDKAGKLSYSKTVLLILGKNITVIKGIRPTMVHNEAFVDIHSATPQAMQAILFDMVGRRVAEYKDHLQEGENRYRLSAGLLAQGLYTLQVKTADGVMANLRFMKE